MFHSYDYLTDQSANSDFEDWDTNIVTENELYNIPESNSGEELWSSEKKTERVEEADLGKRIGSKEASRAAVEKLLRLLISAYI